MATEVVQLTRRRFGQTMRRDAWWIQPLVVFIILSAFVDSAELCVILTYPEGPGRRTPSV